MRPRSRKGSKRSPASVFRRSKESVKPLYASAKGTGNRLSTGKSRSATRSHTAGRLDDFVELVLAAGVEEFHTPERGEHVEGAEGRLDEREVSGQNRGRRRRGEPLPRRGEAPVRTISPAEIPCRRAASSIRVHSESEKRIEWGRRASPVWSPELFLVWRLCPSFGAIFPLPRGLFGAPGRRIRCTKPVPGNDIPIRIGAHRTVAATLPEVRQPRICGPRFRRDLRSWRDLRAPMGGYRIGISP